MTLTEAVGLQTLHRTHTNTQSCEGCAIDVDKLVEEVRAQEEAKELLKSYAR